MREWQNIESVDLSENSPKVDLWVMGASGGRRVCDCWRTTNKWWKKNFQLVEVRGARATHWMPIPKSPHHEA